MDRKLRQSEQSARSPRPADFERTSTGVSPFDTVETAVRQPPVGSMPPPVGSAPARTGRLVPPTAAEPIVGELTYENRVETCLYISRALLRDGRCRVILDQRVVQIEASGGRVSAYLPDGALRAQAEDCPALIMALLTAPPSPGL